MNVIKRNLKRGIALLVAFTLVFGLVPVWTGKIDVVQAATGTTPSVTAFATKQQLMTEFVPNGTNGKVAMIYFGATRGSSYKWYILGKDDGIKDENGDTIDNTIIFAESRLADKQFYTEGYTKNIDDCEYDLENLSDKAKSYLFRTR